MSKEHTYNLTPAEADVVRLWPNEGHGIITQENLMELSGPGRMDGSGRSADDNSLILATLIRKKLVALHDAKHILTDAGMEAHQELTAMYADGAPGPNDPNVVLVEPVQVGENDNAVTLANHLIAIMGTGEYNVGEMREAVCILLATHLVTSLPPSDDIEPVIALGTSILGGAIELATDEDGFAADVRAGVHNQSHRTVVGRA